MGEIERRFASFSVVLPRNTYARGFRCWEDYVQSRDREEEDLQHKRVYREQRKRRDAFKALVEVSKLFKDCVL